jgi:tape measure domain-containing protein
MATVLEVAAKLSGNSTGMVAAFKQAATAAENYRDRVKAATTGAIDSTAAEAKAKLSGTQTGAGFANGFKGALAGVGVLAATVGFGAMVKEAGAASDATDKFKSTMDFAGIDTSAITEAGKAAKSYADQTVYDLPTIQKTIAQLASNGIKDYSGLTKAAGNLNAVAGGNAETFKSVAMTMTQTAGAGKLTTENWNQLSDAIPGAAGPLMRALEEAGAYTGNFREAMEKGQITSDEFNDALMKLGTNPVAVEAAKSTKTFEGAIGGLQATINSGLMGALDKIKPAATGAINGLSSAFGGLFTGFGAIYSLLASGDFTGSIGKALHVEEDNPIVRVLLKVREGALVVQGAFRAMGAAWKDNNGDVTSDGLAGVFERIANGAREVTGGVRAFFAAFADGGNDVTSNGFAGVLESLGLKARELTDTIGPMLSGTFSKIGPVLSQVFAAVGPAFMAVLPSIVTLVSAFSPLSIAIAALTPVIPILAAAAGTLAAALAGALAGALGVVAPILAGIVTGVSQAVTWFMSMDGAAEALAAGIATAVVGLYAYKAVVGTISAVTKAWAAVQAALNAVMAINPVTLIIIGIAALIAAIVLLVMNWDNVVKFLGDTWAGFVGWFQGVMSGFVGWLSGIWSAIVTGITTFASAVFAPIAAGFTAAFSFIMGIFTAIGAFISGVWSWVFNLLIAIGQAFWAEHGAQLTAAWNFVVSIFTAIGNFIASVWNAIGAGVSAAWNWITGIISGALSAIWGVVSAIFNAVWGFISGIFNTIAGFISGVWNGIFSFLSGIIGNIYNTVKSKFDAVYNTVSSIFNSVSSFIGNIWSGIVTTVGDRIQSVVDTVTGIKDKVVNAVSGAAGWLSAAGANVVQGFINGISSLAGTIGNAFLNMVPGWIVGPFKTALGIASPSKLFKQFGRWVIQGLGIGVNQEQRTAVKAMDQAAAAVTAAGSGITLSAPVINVPQMPDIAANLALPELTQNIRLNFIGSSPMEAVAAMARAVALQGPDGYLAASNDSGYSPAVLGARTAAGAQQGVPEVHVNVTAVVANPWTGEQVQAYVTDVATEVTAGSLSGTARVVRNSRSGGKEGF